MKVVACPVITDAALASSSFPAADYPEFDPLAVYAAGARVSRAATRRNYVRSGPGTSSTAPESDPANWTDDGFGMRWRMFDPEMAMPSEASGSMSTSIYAGRTVTDVVLEGVVGSTLQITAGGATLRSISVPAPVAPFTAVVVHVSGLSVPAGQAVGFSLSGSGTVRIAYFLAGELSDVGVTLDEPQWGITDRSTIETDDYGVTRVVPRPYNRWIQARVFVPGTDLDRVRPLMEDLRAAPAYWIADERFAAMCCVGSYSEWSADVDSEESSVYTLRIDAVAADDTAISPGGFVTSAASGVSMVESANYSVVIESTNGTVFQAGTGLHTLLIGHVFRNGEEVTSTIPESWFRWRRVSLVPQAPPNDDATWNTAYSSGYKQVDVSVDDVLSKAAFNLDIVKP